MNTHALRPEQPAPFLKAAGLMLLSTMFFGLMAIVIRIASDAGIARRFLNFGFTPGVVPQGPSLGAMSELTNLLLRALDVRDQVAAAR